MKMKVEKTISEINERIKDGCVRVITADEMSEIVKELGPEEAAKEVDVVTTGTFGAMCSSGAFFNFGHADPPIKMQKVWLNGVEAYTGVAAVDAYIGAAQLSEDRGDGIWWRSCDRGFGSGEAGRGARSCIRHGLLSTEGNRDNDYHRRFESGNHDKSEECISKV